MRPDGDKDNKPPLLDPFVRFKYHVDSKFSSAFDTMLGSSSPDGSSAEANRSSSVKALASLLTTPYSPDCLRHLPQPVPNDLPQGLDRSVFTFEDAYEDLLAVTAGQPLPDINQRYGQRQLLRQMFPSGEPRWFWIRRLESSGLLSASQTPSAVSPHWELLHEELDRLASDVWGRGERIRDDSMETITELRDRLAHEVASLGSTVSGKKEGSEPNHFDDLFLSLQEFADSGKRSWDAFMKSLTEHNTALERRNREPPETKVEETREEHIDRAGYVHSKVTLREVDSQGNEVGRSTIYEVYPASEKDRNQSADWEDDGNRDGPQKALDGDERKKASGWFWK